MSERITAGTEIGDYVVRGLLGKGGMGTVYRAEHRAGGEPVALKVLAEELTQGQEFRRRFLREVRYATELGHPNVVRVLEAGDAGGRLYMAQQLVEGGDLRALLELEGALDAERTLAILRQVAAALDAAHAAGIVHRDVKPANVLIASGVGGETPGHSYLTDFGLSKSTTRDSVALTSVGEFVGSLHYAAPEQVLGGEVTGAVDVYSLGCLLYEGLAGAPPFERIRAADLLEAHIEDPPPRVTAKRPDLPPAIDAVVERAMAKDPGRRFARCAELIDAAEGALGGQGTIGALTLTLLVTGGPALGEEIVVTEGLDIGRNVSGAGAFGGDAELSRRHASIRRVGAGDRFELEDLGSTNGTLVNGAAVESATELREGDLIELGATTLAVKGSTHHPGPRAKTKLSIGLHVSDAPLRAALRLDHSEVLRLVSRGGRWRWER